jgi:hypothetical protein
MMPKIPSLVRYPFLVARFLKRGGIIGFAASENANDDKDNNNPYLSRARRSRHPAY